MRRSTTGEHEAPLPTMQAVGYATGNFGKNILWNSLEFCLLYILTDIMLVNPAVAGTIVTASVIWDAILYPLFGFAADKTHTRMGKYGPFIILGAPLCSLSFICLFYTPLLPSDQRLLLLIISLFAFRGLYSLIDLPHNALLARISHTQPEQSRLSGLRYFFSCLGSLAIASALDPVLAEPAANRQADYFLSFAIVAGVISCLVLWLSWWSVRSIDAGITCRNRTSPVMLRGLPAVLRCNYFRLTLAIIFITGLSTPAFTKTLIYYAKYVVEDSTMASFALIEFTLGSALGTLLWIRMARHRSTASSLTCSHLLILLVSVIFYLLCPTTPVSLGLTASLAGLAAAGAYTLIWALASNAVTEVERFTGTRYEATIFALFILAMKVAIGLGSAIVGWLLSVSGYVPDSIQLPGALHGIRLIMCGIPALGSVLIVAVLNAPNPFSRTESRQL